MKRAAIPFRVHFFLFLTIFLGLALCVLIPVDAEWLHVVLKPPTEKPEQPALGGTTEISGQTEDRLRQSILNVRVTQCHGQGEKQGTGFVIKSGYVATAAHILGNQQSCGSTIRVIDHRGLEHPAQLDGISAETDLALLRISGAQLPALDLADSTPYENINRVVRVVTLGYPLEGIGSTSDRAAFSGQGNLSRFDRTHNLFITSGMNLNQGNSGGPIFLLDNWRVLGVATAKLDTEFGEGIGIVTPMKTVEQFFREKTGQELR